MVKHTALGAKGETIAKFFLEGKGYTILKTNWRFEKCEVDIIASLKNMIVFAEVKTRSGNQFGFPEVAVNKTKQQLLSKAAKAFLEQEKRFQEIRFDIISITMKKGTPHVYHIKDAFFLLEE